MSQLLKLFIITLIFVSGSFAAEEVCSSCGDACACENVCECNHEPRAPMGVMGDHVHHKGSWMVSYRYMLMNMDGLDDEASAGPMWPKSMDMQMHMFGAMYTPLNNLTIGLMVPYLVNDMEMENGAEMSSDGVGDLKLSGIYRLWTSSAQQVLLNLAVSFPTGSINERGPMMMNPDARLPYPMQLGSGSYGLIPGITYSGLSKGWGWGAQAKGTFYLNENDNAYTLGNRYGLNIWGLRDLCTSSALTLRLNGSRVENIDGADPQLNPMMTPLADPDLRAGTRLDLLAGIDYRKGSIRLALEGGVPVAQKLDGPQLETKWMIIGGLQLTF